MSADRNTRWDILIYGLDTGRVDEVYHYMNDEHQARQYFEQVRKRIESGELITASLVKAVTTRAVVEVL